MRVALVQCIDGSGIAFAQQRRLICGLYMDRYEVELSRE